LIAETQLLLSRLRLVFEGRVVLILDGSICAGFNRGWLVFEGGF